MSRSVEEIADDLLAAALSWEPHARVIGNVTALEVTRLVAPLATSCPACCATPGMNDECRACLQVSGKRGSR